MSDYTDSVMTAIRQVMDIESHYTMTPDTALIDDLGFDSGLYLDLNLQLEENITGLKMDPSRMKSEDFKTVRTISAFVKACMEKQLEDAP
jgi:acyl carrier protein